MVIRNEQRFGTTQFSPKADLQERNYECFSVAAKCDQPQNFLFVVIFGSIFGVKYTQQFV